MEDRAVGTEVLEEEVVGRVEDLEVEEGGEDREGRE